MAAREVYWAFGQPSNKSVCVTRWQDATDGDWTKRFFSGDRINKTQITADNSIEKGRNEHVYLICSRFATVQRIYLVTFFQFQAFFHARNALFGSIRCSIFQIDPLASHLWWVGQILGLPDLFFGDVPKKNTQLLGFISVTHRRKMESFDYLMKYRVSSWHPTLRRMLTGSSNLPHFVPEMWFFGGSLNPFHTWDIYIYNHSITIVCHYTRLYYILYGNIMV